MSQYDPTLSVLGIPDHNIKVAFVRHEYRGNGVRRRQYHVIDAELTYRLTRCPLCGFEALHPNRFYTTHVRVLNGVEMPRQSLTCTSNDGAVIAVTTQSVPRRHSCNPTTRSLLT